MSIARRILFSVTSFLLVCSLAQADQGDDLVRVKLIADTSAIKPGEPFTIGVNLQITPGWHVYWINPGDSGEATKVTWTLPPGFMAGELKFPVPERIVLPGDIISYGYENDVTLIATITPPQDLQPGQRLSLGAQAHWLVCEKVCLPGGGEASLELPVSQSSQQTNAEFFKGLWFADLPTANVSVEAKPLDLSSGKGETEIGLSAELAGDFEVFPYPLDNATISIGKVRKDGRMSVIPISVSVLPNQRVSAKTWNVLVVSRTVPNRFAYDVPVRIVTGGAGAPSPQGK